MKFPACARRTSFPALFPLKRQFKETNERRERAFIVFKLQAAHTNTHMEGLMAPGMQAIENLRRRAGRQADARRESALSLVAGGECRFWSVNVNEGRKDLSFAGCIPQRREMCQRARGFSVGCPTVFVT